MDEKQDVVDIELDIDSEEKFTKGATEIALMVRPGWSRDEIGFHQVSEGITNKLTGVFSTTTSSCKYDDMILIKGYGHGSDLLIDRDAEVRNMMLLSAHGCGSKLYCRFRNGLAYQFLPGETLSVESVRSRDIFPMVAKMMRILHDLSLPEVEGKPPTACIWNLLRKFHSALHPSFPKKVEELFNRNQLAEEIREMELALKPDADQLGKVVFCHNDVLLANIVVSPDQETLRFIDYEYGNTNYREYDIANHFCEFVGTDAKELDYENLYPDRDFQLRWIGVYLGSQGVNNDATEVKKMQCLVERFSPLPSLLWGIWAVVQAQNSSIDFDYPNYAIQRLKEYKRRKHLALAT